MTDLMPKGLTGKLINRVALLLIIGYFFNYLDRTAVSVAALQMRADLDISAAAFGLGAGLFFIGYAVCELPSNILLHKVGARVWMARIMTSWGVISVLTCLVQGEMSFYVMRILLGVAEAGAYPGILLIFTNWFPSKMRGKAIASLEILVLLSLAFGAVGLGAVLNLDQFLGLAGWRWIFIVAGIPAVVLGLLVLFLLPERPEKAKWLTPQERTWLVSTLAAEAQEKEKLGASTLKSALSNARVWYLCVLYFMMVVGFWGITFWLPQIIQSKFEGISDFGASALSALPWMMAIGALIFVSTSSDRANERRWHAAVPLMIAAVALVISVFVSNPWIALLGIGVAAAGQRSATPVFWNLPAGLVTGLGAAGALALINSVGNLGGFVGPYVLGYFSDLTGSSNGGLLIFAACFVVAAVMIVLYRDPVAKNSQIPVAAASATESTTPAHSDRNRSPQV
ncbi:MFS transporter [Brevibacterium oceani]|uniref:MFS transporter n=1 Tax=Brevibacterium oceani TaxID=358099 RepID=UPI001B32725A|nr:MFS transporter [Brevibacterium oceani]